MIILALYLQTLPGRDSAATAVALRATVAVDANALMQRPAIPDVREILISAYQRGGWRPLWIQGAAATPAARRLLAELGSADAHGLEPEQYDASRLAAEADSLAGRTPDALAGFDVALAAAAARYAIALDRGRVPAEFVHPTLDLPREAFDPARLLLQLSRAADPAGILRGLEPGYLHYRLLVAALARYRRVALAEAAMPGSWPAAIRPADTSTAVPELRRLLHLVGDLGDRDAARGSVDSLRYDASMVAAVRRFHARTGSPVDSTAGPGLRPLLLQSLGDRMHQMVLALERWRWLPRTLAPTTLFVNIPAFRLFTLDGSGDRDTPTLAMDVVVGRALENDTPLLATHIAAIQTHPAWVVPRAIALKEIVPPALRDTAYLARHHYQLLRADSVVPPTRANVRRIGESIHVRQAPGPWNALGRLKFVTPNSVDIYLHDTPDRKYFRQIRRDFSHGCIRVADPIALARFVLRDDSTWTAERLAAALADTTSQFISLRKPVPVFILYQTASIRESGEVSFYPDVYGNDRLLDQVLRAGYPYPAPPPRASGRGH